MAKFNKKDINISNRSKVFIGVGLGILAIAGISILADRRQICDIEEELLELEPVAILEDAVDGVVDAVETAADALISE